MGPEKPCGLQRSRDQLQLLSSPRAPPSSFPDPADTGRRRKKSLRRRRRNRDLNILSFRRDAQPWREPQTPGRCGHTGLRSHFSVHLDTLGPILPLPFAARSPSRWRTPVSQRPRVQRGPQRDPSRACCKGFMKWSSVGAYGCAQHRDSPKGSFKKNVHGGTHPLPSPSCSFIVPENRNRREQSSG